MAKLQPALLSLLLAAPFLLAGCCTSAMWQDDHLARFYEPAPAANLQLYYSERQRDVLVEYNEVKEDSASTRQRCYWMGGSQLRIDRGQKPHFVSSRSQAGLTPIPFRPDAFDFPNPNTNRLYAVMATNGQSFTLYSNASELATHKLPFYYDRRMQYAERALLLPATTTVDATVVGGVAVYYLAPLIWPSLPALNASH